MSTGGYLAHSLAILTDAAHLLTDFASIMISLFALWVSSRPPTKTMNFGWYRAGKLVTPPWGCHQSPPERTRGFGVPWGALAECWHHEEGKAEVMPALCKEHPQGWVSPPCPSTAGGPGMVLGVAQQ